MERRRRKLDSRQPFTVDSINASGEIEVSFDADGVLFAANEDSAGLPRVSVKAYNGGKLSLGNFRHPVVIDVSAASVHGGAKQLPLLRDHDQGRVVGHGTPTITAKDLQHDGELSVPGNERDQITAAHANGFEWQASVGGRIVDPKKNTRTIAAGQTVTVNGRVIDGPVHVVRGFLWKETSFVAVGADEDRASAALAASQTKRSVLMNEFEKWLVAAGLKADELSDETLGSLKATWEASIKPAEKIEVKAAASSADTAEMIAAATRQAQREERVRARRIDSIFAQYSGADRKLADEIRGKLEAEEISEEGAQLELLKASRAGASAVVSGLGQEGCEAVILEAAMQRQAGIAETEIEAGLLQNSPESVVDIAMNQSATRRYKDVGFKRLIAACCAQAGHSFYSIGDEELRAAMDFSQRSVHASSGFSTVSLPGIMSNLANKAMLTAYAEADAGGVMLRIASTTSTNDFKKFTRYRMTESGVAEEVPADGEIAHGTLQEETYENQLKQYAKMLTLTRVMMMNDDIGAFLQIPRMLGRQARHALEQQGIATLVNATTTAAAGTTEFFHGAVRGTQTANYLEGASTNLSLDSLESAYELFLNQVDADGKPIMIDPGILLTCTGDAVMAAKLYKDTEYRFTTASLKETVNNQWRGMFTPEKSSYLGRLGTTANTSQWYLMANPTTDISAIQVAFLNNQRTPAVSSAEADFNVLGYKWRVVYDFGIGMQDPRAAVKVKGKA